MPTQTAQHTPGPWDFVRRPLTDEKSQWRIFDQHGIEIADSPVGPQAFNVANARLIAAAPDLLAALEAMVAGRLVGGGIGESLLAHTDAELNAARAAIEAARA